MKIRFCSLFILLGLFLTPQYSFGQISYFPTANEWETKAPSALGVNETLLNRAISFAKTNEYKGSKDLRIAILEGFAREPYHKILGPTKKRGGPAGIILKDGYIIAQWGDVVRVDMTFSVTKSYLSTVGGLAVDKNLFDPEEYVKNYVWDGTFDGEHNGKIQWKHLFNQTSDWSGTLWGGHDWADRPPKKGELDDWKNRTLNAPGTFFEYNDVRVNLLAYSLLHVWRKPLPQILKEYIMDPIGASPTWRWFGYENSWTEIDGSKVQSVSGGGHSGGGLFINTLDHARFGLLFLNQGKWKDQQLISKEWIQRATTPLAPYPNYGYMWWLNHKAGTRYWPGVPENVYYAAGFGGNYIVIVPDSNVVIVTRWLNPKGAGEFVAKVLTALQ